ncbi:alcohol oxidase [Mycena sanguinolenta]|nr:alcohol oxidase [Mycena sanguinolenta]
MKSCVAIATIALLPAVRGVLQSCPDLTDAPDVFDFIVVGSGAGGGPLAARLAENGFSVFLVDAGNDVDTFNTTLPAYFARATEDPTIELAYNIKEFSDPDSRIAWYPRARALGGSTMHNAMINIIANTQADFDDISTNFGDPSWTRSNMQEYFKKLEKNLYLLPTLLTLADHGFTGWLKTTLLPYLSLLNNLDIVDPQLLTIFSSLTLSPNPPIIDLNDLAEDGSVGINTPSFTVDENHVRSSVYNRLTAVNESTSGLNITLNTLATKILLCQGSDGLPTAYGLEFVRNAALPVAGNFQGKEDLDGRVQSVMARHEVIVSAGVFQSPQLLMLSGIGNSTELSEFGIETVVDLPGVGTNLQDHDEIVVIWDLVDDFKLLEGCTFLSDPAQDPCLEDWLETDHMNIYGFSPVLDVIITKSNEALAAPDIFTYLAPAYFEGIFRGFSQEVVDHPNGFTAIVLKAHPSSRGFVRLTGSHPQDILDIEKMHFEAEQGPEDMQALADGINRIRSLVENSAIKEFIVQEAVPGSDANLTQYILDRVFGHHACCTNPIGPSTDPNAVLDNDFRVHGVDQLRVVDLSSWPNVPGYFVTTPTYMISEKAADVIMSAAQARNSK